MLIKSSLRQGGPGYTGSHGYTGSQGEVGYTGSQGVGYTGSLGATGPTGYTGSLGATAGSNTTVSFNDSGAANGVAGFTFNKTTNNVSIGNNLSVGTIVTGSTITAGGNTTVFGFMNVSSTANVGGATTLRSTLDVTGAATISNSFTVSGGSATTLTGLINVASTANVGGNTNLRGTLTVNGAVTIANTAALGNTTVTGTLTTTDSMGVGTTFLTGVGLAVTKNITGSVNSNGILSDGVTQSDVVNYVQYFKSQPQTASSIFTLSELTHYSAYQSGAFSNITAGGAVTSQFGFHAASTLSAATNNYGFYSQLAAATGDWNFYAAGTAANYMAGSLSIGTTTTTGISLSVSKTMTGATNLAAVLSNGAIQSDVTSYGMYFRSTASTQSAIFALASLMHYYASGPAAFANVTAGGAVTNQYGFFVESNLAAATNNYGFYSAIPLSTGDWNVYIAGTAWNYFAGQVGIGSTALTQYVLRVSKGITGASQSYGVAIDSTIDATVNNTGYAFWSAVTTAASTAVAALIHYGVVAPAKGASSTIVNQYGFAVGSGMTTGTNNYGVYSSIPAATGNWNFYAAGTGANYFAGIFGLGSVSLTGFNFRNSLAITGATVAYANYSDGAIQSGVTATGAYYTTVASTAAAAFTTSYLAHYYATQGTIGAGSTVTNQYGLNIGASLVGATNNYGVYSNIPVGTGDWNFYAAGTAPNYFAGATTFAAVVSAPGIQLTTGGTNAAGVMGYTDANFGMLLRPRIAGAIYTFAIKDTADSKYLISITDAGAVIIPGSLTVNGSVTGAGFIDSSDLRFKKNVNSIANALEKVTKLHGVTFTRIKDNKDSTGLIAQDVQKVIPEAVHTDDDGYLYISYGNLMGLIVEAIKELQQKIK